MTRLLGHLGRQLVSIAIGRPKYKDMKDGFATAMTYAAIALGATFPGILICWGLEGGNNPVAQLYWVGMSLIPIAFVAFFLSSVTPTVFMFSAAMYGVCAVVDLVALGLYALGVLEWPLGWWHLPAQGALGALCYVHYLKQPDQVRTKGYGLKPGEV